MKEKFQFLYDSITKGINDLNSKKISVEHAKSLASLAKQANNTIATQLDASKFLANIKDAKDYLLETGLIQEDETTD
jgi:hypothetical protein